MKKKNFVTLILSTIGGILFALGMCMALLPQWNAMNQGVVTGGAGLVVLLIMVLVRRRMEGKPVVSLNFRTVAIAPAGHCGCADAGSGHEPGHAVEPADPRASASGWRALC